MRALPSTGPWRGGVVAGALLAAVAAPGAAGAVSPRAVHTLTRVTPAGPASVLLSSTADAAVVATRARAARCARRAPVVLTVRVDGAAVGQVRLHSSRWRALRFHGPVGPGDHRVRVTATGRRGCAAATLDELRLTPATQPGDDEGHATPRGPLRAIPVNAAARAELALGSDQRLQDTFLSHFDGLTPENEMKMGIVEPSPGTFAFRQADALVDYAQRHGKSVRGHTLIWQSQLPGWLTRRRWSRADMLAVMHQWIGAIVGRYRGRIADWDVLNELFDAAGDWRPSPWYVAIGPDLADAALRAAHDADPAARLFINDFDIERPGPKQDAVFALVRDLRLRGVPIDGVGIQAHWSIGDLVPEQMLLTTLRRFASLGVRVELTELDVMTDHQPDALLRQAAAYAMAGRVCQAVAACDRVTVWGISDRDSWRGAANRALLFDTDFLEKPAYAALRDALAAT